MTATEIITHATYLADSVGDTKWDATKSLAYVNEGLKSLWHTLISFKNPVIQKSAALNITPDTTSYTLTTIAADFLDITSVFDNTNNVLLTEISFNEKLDYDGDENCYYRFGNKIYFCYTPTAARELELIYSPTFTALGASDDPAVVGAKWLPVNYHELVAYYVAIRMLMEDGQRPADSFKDEYKLHDNQFREWAAGITNPAKFKYEAFNG